LMRAKELTNNWKWNSMSKISAEVITHSIGPNGVEIFTILALYPRYIHSEVLRHRNISHSVASSRAIPAAKLMEQVKHDPAMPVLWPKEHHGMQGTEVFPDMDIVINSGWNCARRDAIAHSDSLSESGLSKQLTNRLIEPWVMCRDVMTFTKPQIKGFFTLRHPWRQVGTRATCSACSDTFDSKIVKIQKSATTCMSCGAESMTYTPITEWEDEVNLKFPAEYNIQQLAIEIKRAMDASVPASLAEGEYHLPFMENTVCTMNGLGGSLTLEQGIKVSAARCAMTSYNTNKGRSIEMELDLADRLMKDHHWSPFEHQAMAISNDEPSYYYGKENRLPKGLEMRTTASG